MKGRGIRCWRGEGSGRGIRCWREEGSGDGGEKDQVPEGRGIRNAKLTKQKILKTAI